MEHWSLVDILIISQVIEHLTVAIKTWPQVKNKKTEVKISQPV
jgi:hypothetical protein